MPPKPFSFDPLTSNAEENVSVNCSDGNCVLLSASLCAKCSFLKKEGGKTNFDFSSVVLEFLAQWISHSSLEKNANRELPVPCLFRSFSFVPTSKWNIHFFEQITAKEKIRHFLPTIKAAEKYNITDLLDLLCMGLGCKLRGEDEDLKELFCLSHSMDFSEEELAKVPEDYPFFDVAVNPQEDDILA